jgi:hypothetical protein
MTHANILSSTIAMLAVLPLWGQAESAEQKSPCVAEPVFHCVQNLDGGEAMGHFGYRLQCPDDAGPDADLFLDIGEKNLFSPGRIDRGQPKIFLPGEHIDEFVVDYTAEEVKAGTALHWSVLDKTVTVDFTVTKDSSLDCSVLK